MYAKLPASFFVSMIDYIMERAFKSKKYQVDDGMLLVNLNYIMHVFVFLSDMPYIQVFNKHEESKNNQIMFFLVIKPTSATRQTVFLFPKRLAEKMTLPVSPKVCQGHLYS